MKRNFFSLVWTIAPSIYAPSLSGLANSFMITWTIFGFPASLITFLALFLSNGEEPSALTLSVKAQEIGQEKGQKGGLLWDLVKVPAEWRKISEVNAPLNTPCTSANGLVKSQESEWTRWLSNIKVVPPAFVCSLAVALFCMYWVPRNREKSMGLRGFSAFCGPIVLPID
ncbi:uncharacterized protein M421DRAFT_5987 [Didymella exigua CBS 183.55]|uniref:Uncharacterized protein n=1 Tax=Didymella exigua CBS 183.55 TaxID=1150837 RepID=A0A6A5RQG8_9PLEO|nr:uncharacterized protein M421DRAFT_5987 [Didymella exigua CBS 183.55]KAF1927727.1 hypothetical protein M421DRAFT_5987 [Didymella exigua CBS 183.55]